MVAVLDNAADLTVDFNARALGIVRFLHMRHSVYDAMINNLFNELLGQDTSLFLPISGFVNLNHGYSG